MKYLVPLFLAVLFALSPARASAQTCAPGNTCVSSEDLQAFMAVLKEKQCLSNTKPTFTLDPVTLVVDKEGRIFYTGADPKPYSLKMAWCNYSVEAQGKVDVVAAVQEPPTWGFRFRPKAYLGFLPGEALRSGGSARSATDAGLMIDPFYYKYFNFNVLVGFRSVGAGLGVDIFRSFGAYAGYAVTWDGFRSNPEAALWFSFW